MNPPFNTAKSITLIELLVSIVIVTIMVLSFYILITSSQWQVINSERRAKVQNQLAYALEHMTKYIQQANGDISNLGSPRPAIVLTVSGFQVRVDFRNPQVPSDLNNSAWVSYSLVGNTLSTSCTAYGAGTCGSFIPETLTNKIIGSFVADTIMPANPTNGFYVRVDPLGNLVDIGLVGRYNTSSPVTLENPQVGMKTKIICNNSSAN